MKRVLCWFLAHQMIVVVDVWEPTGYKSRKPAVVHMECFRCGMKQS